MWLKPFVQRHKKTLLLVILLFSFVGSYALLLGVFMPYYLQQKLPIIIKERSSLSLEIDDVHINPFYLSVEINHFNLEDLNKQSLAAFERLYINFQLSSLFRQLWYFDALIIESPKIHYQIYSDFSRNVEQLLTLIDKENKSLPTSTSKKQELASEPTSVMPALLIETLRIDKLAIQFTDDTKKTTFNANVGPVNITLDNFTTQKDLNSPYVLKATSGSGILGSSFEWQGFIKFLPFRSEGQLVINEINLPKSYQYVKDDFSILLPSGTLNLTANYRVDLSKETILFDIDNANLRFLDIVLQRDGQDSAVIKLGELLLKNVNYSSTLHQLSLDQLALNNSNVRLVIDKKGVLNLNKIFPQSTSESRLTGIGNESLTKDRLNKDTPLKLAIDNITFNDNTLLFTDNSTPTATKLSVSQINMDMASFNLQPSSYFPINLSAVIEEVGTVETTGDFSISPLSSRLDISAKNLPVLNIE